MTQSTKTLVKLLASLGIEVKGDARLERVVKAGYDEAWSWRLLDGEGNEVAGSQWTVVECLKGGKEDRVQVYCPPWSPASTPELMVNR